MEVIYVSYEQARKLIPIMKQIAETHQWRETRESAKRLLQELKLVRGDISYDPLAGRQVILRSELDRNFLKDALSTIEE